MKKRKHFFRAAGALFAVICILTSLSLSVSAERKYSNCLQNCRLYDPDHVIEESFAVNLNQRIQETSDAIDMYIAVCIVNQSSTAQNDSETEKAADNRYDELFNPQYGEDSDGLLLWIDIPSRYLYITTSGRGELFYYDGYNGDSEDRISDMVSRLLPYLSQADYSGAVECFCKDAESYYKRGVPRGAYTYNSTTGMYRYLRKGELTESEKKPFWIGIPWGILITVGVLLGGLTGVIIFLVESHKNETVPSLTPSNYICHQDTVFTVKDDIFLRKHVTQSPISSSAGAGSVSYSENESSHQSDSGNSHSGGGGHW